MDTCCFCLPGSQAWLLGTASRIFLGGGRGAALPHTRGRGSGTRGLSPLGACGPGLGLWGTEAGLRAARVPLGTHRAPGPGWGRVSGRTRPLPAGFAELAAILSPLESGCLRTQPSPGRWGEGDGEGSRGGNGAGVGRASKRDHPSPGVQLRREQLGPDVRAKNLLCASARWSWVPSFVTKRLFRNVCDKLGVKHESEGRIWGVRVTQELHVHSPGRSSRATGQRGRSWREAPSPLARGAPGRGPGLVATLPLCDISVSHLQGAGPAPNRGTGGSHAPSRVCRSDSTCA